MLVLNTNQSIKLNTGCSSFTVRTTSAAAPKEQYTLLVDVNIMLLGNMLYLI
jgi:hypothetical protein